MGKKDTIYLHSVNSFNCAFKKEITKMDFRIDKAALEM